MFIKIGDIKGESAAVRHKDEIEVLGFNWGASGPSAASVGFSGGAAGKGQVSPFRFTARSSRASPLLFQACAAGKHFKDAVLSLVRPVGGQGQEFMVWKLTNVLVSAYRTGGDVDGPAPVDEVELSFDKVEMQYQLFELTGTKGELVKVGWDVKLNKGV